MRQNQNPILRCTVAEGKSGDQHRDHQKLRIERQEGDPREEAAERPRAAPHVGNLPMKLRLAEKFFSDIGRNRHAKSLALICLDHQQYPQTQAHEIHNPIQGIAHRKASQTSGQ